MFTRVFRHLGFCAAVWLLTAAAAFAQDTATADTATSDSAPTAGVGVIRPATLSCQSAVPGERQYCAANTASGVSIVKSTGAIPCLLGKTWGYDDTGIWVTDGCSGEFVAGAALQQPADDKNTPEHVPNVGFLLYDGEKGQIYFRLFSYARYLNQRSLDASYVDAFGRTHSVQQRQDFQLVKFFSPFTGWFLTPNFRYYLYVWSANTSQGDPAQVVGAGNLSYRFATAATFGFGITSLPSTRSTEGQFPYWLGVDNRLIADEFFRGSYTTGIWLKGELPFKAKYMAMLANNLSQLGVSATQLDNRIDTESFMFQWLPTTGENGLFGTFGDFDDHQTVATRLGVHYTHSFEDKQSQPGTEAIENSQIRLTDGSIVFTPNLFGPGVVVNSVDYHMLSVDGGAKYRGLSLEGEYYRRRLTNFEGPNTTAIADVTDDGFQLQSSAMVVPTTLQLYLSGSQIRGDFGDGSDLRAGANWYFRHTRGLRVNAELIHLNHCPVGYAAVPYPVGGNGNLLHLNLELNF